jgi:hypothetical protein
VLLGLRLDLLLICCCGESVCCSSWAAGERRWRERTAVFGGWGNLESSGALFGGELMI